MNAWSELPNADHIDWVLASLKSNIDIWNQANDQAWSQSFEQAYDQALDHAWDQAWVQAWKQARNQVRVQARDQARGQAWNQAYEQTYARYQTYDQVGGVLLALVAYDDCDQYLRMSYSELKTWALVSENSQAILLLPMVYVKEQINECLV